MANSYLVTAEQMHFILSHINVRPRRKVAKEAGVSLSTFYRIIRENGGTLDRSLSTANAYARDIVKAEYPYKSASEISEQYGFGKSLVARWASRLGIEHTLETKRRLEEKVDKARRRKRSPETQAVISRKWKRKRKLEILRVMSGLPQETKFRIRILPVRVKKAIWHLRTLYGYLQKEENSTTLFYDKETKRTKMEHLYTKRYGIRFVMEQ